MLEINEGYEIIASESYHIGPSGREERIVLGYMETKYGPQYVTWDGSKGRKCEVPNSYFWGHYFSDEKEARADYHSRLAEKYASNRNYHLPSDEG